MFLGSAKPLLVSLAAAATLWGCAAPPQQSVAPIQDITPERALAIDCQRGSRTSCEALARAHGGSTPTQQTTRPTISGSQTAQPAPSTQPQPAARPAPPAADPSVMTQLIADRLVGTNAVSVDEQRAAGALTGCGMVFNVGLRDHIYRGGGVVVVNGSINIQLLQNGTLIWSVKLVPTDVSWNSNTRDIQTSVFDPSYGWISAGSFSSAQNEAARFRCENGGFCAGGNANIVEAIDGIMQGGSLSFGFRRTGGTLDVQSRVLIAGQQGAAQQQRFTSCIVNLADRLQRETPSGPAPQRSRGTPI